MYKPHPLPPLWLPTKSTVLHRRNLQQITCENKIECYSLRHAKHILVIYFVVNLIKTKTFLNNLSFY